MKRLILPALLVLALLFNVQGYSQTVKLDNQFTIQVTDQVLEQKFIQLDISGLQFKNEEAAEKFFRSIANNLVDFELNYASQTAIMNLYPERLSNHVWTLDDWNSYMASTSQRCSATYQSFLNE